MGIKGGLEDLDLIFAVLSFSFSPFFFFTFFNLWNLKERETGEVLVVVGV